MNKYSFENRVAVVTGGAQGFGYAISKRIIESGGKVIIWDIDKSAIDKAKKEINSNNFHSQEVDIIDFKNIEKAISDIETKFGKIDIFINNGFEVHLFLPNNGPLNTNKTIKKIR